MTDKVKKRLALLLDKKYRLSRSDSTSNYTDALNDCKSLYERAGKLFAYTLSEEKPLFHGDDDDFGFNRYNAKLCEDESKIGHMYQFGNIIIDYATYLKKGLRGIREDILSRCDGADSEAKDFYDSALVVYDACFDIIARYRESAKEYNPTLYEALCVVPERGATSYYEACVMIRFIHYALRLARNQHLTLGRFDQYMKPYYDASVQRGASREKLLETTELFFISMNFDADVYMGIQQGDNGQSMVLGGCDREGADAFNELSEICLLASEELKIIDPKINVRVNKNTPLSLYERCTRLTKQGLGFPQYCNDDIIIPAMVEWGYALDDARDYGVAACWEVITSGCGADIPNVSCLNYPLAVERATEKYLTDSQTFEQFLRGVDGEVRALCDQIIEKHNATWAYENSAPAPFISTLVNPCIERGRDLTRGGAKYNNFGAHGAGLSTAADALAAIKKVVFEDKSVKKSDLLDALHANFVGYENLRKILVDCPKMGNNDDFVDEIGCFLMDSYARHFSGRRNSRGGIYRAGTGSAMEYINSAEEVGATADGRKAHDVYGCSYAPAIGAKTLGPLSVVQSFTKFDLKRVCNGGPFTIEMHDTVFRNDEGEKKVAMLVKTFIDLGGHQIQINAINRDVLLDAQNNPDKYPTLIVRVWGWSGYFNELETKYQDHVIRRMEFTFG